MKILVVGGAGFVGAALARTLRVKYPSSKVVAADNLKRRGSELNLRPLREDDIEFVHLDIRNPADFDALDSNFDTIIDASAEPSVLAGIGGSPDYVVNANLVGTFNCLNFARRRGGRFIFLSTSRVYSIEPLTQLKLVETATRFTLAADQSLPGVTTNGISEAFPTHLYRSLYGATKIAAEYLIQEFVHAYHLKAAMFRCGVIAGPGQFGKADQGVFTLWIANHYFGKPLVYTGFGGTGKQVRDLLHIADLCELVVGNLALESLYTGNPMNVGGGMKCSTSLAEFTVACRSIIGKDVPVAARSETGLVDVPFYVSDCSLLFSQSSWRPRKTIEEIIQDTVQWIRQNEDVLRNIL